MSTRNTSKSEDTYKSVWDTLAGVDCSEYVEKKNGLSFLSWAWAWGILMEYYPKATYSFSSPVRDEFGTVEVWCTVKIGDLERRMWLPVMDYKNNAIKNPDLRKISDTRMRCLTKCIGMFGLGHYIYAGEDIPAGADTEEPEPPKPASKKKAEKKPAPPTENKSPAKADPGPSAMTVSNAEEAANVVVFLIDTVTEFASDSVQSLKEFYGQNKPLIDLLDSQYPEQYAKLRDHLSALKAKLMEEAA